MAFKGEALQAVDTETGEIVQAGQIRLPETFVPDSWEDIEKALEGDLIEFQGSPYEVVEKSKLVGEPFIITNLRFWEGDKGDVVSVMLLTKDGKKLVFNDGSTGVYRQLKYIVSQTNRFSGIKVMRGLRSSTYETQEKDFDGNPIGKPFKATTYYLA